MAIEMLEQRTESGKSKLIRPVVLLLIYESFKCLATIICILRCHLHCTLQRSMLTSSTSVGRSVSYFEKLWWKVNIIAVIKHYTYPYHKGCVDIFLFLCVFLFSLPSHCTTHKIKYIVAVGMHIDICSKHEKARRFGKHQGTLYILNFVDVNSYSSLSTAQ